jgi:hypothetical protein
VAEVVAGRSDFRGPIGQGLYLQQSQTSQGHGPCDDR